MISVFDYMSIFKDVMQEEKPEKKAKSRHKELSEKTKGGKRM